MKNKVNILVFLILMLVMALPATQVQADHASDREHQIKAAFIYNFIKFIDWSDEKTPVDSNSITIGVVGEYDSIKAFDPIKSKQVKGKNITIKLFEAFDNPDEFREKKNSRWKEKINALKKCHVVFICTGVEKKTEIPVELIEALKGSGVLFIGETPGFLDNGGVINFIMEDKKVRFEINANVAEDNGLKIRSQLLKLAKQVIRKEEQRAERGNNVNVTKYKNST